MMSYLYCKHLRIQLLEPQALDFTSRLFKDVLHFFVFVLVAVSLSHVTAAIMVWFSGAVRSIGVDPLTLEGGLIYQTVLGLLGATGINAHNMLFAIKQQIYAATEANMAAWQAGEASLNVISQVFTTPFCLWVVQETVSVCFCVS